MRAETRGAPLGRKGIGSDRVAHERISESIHTPGVGP